MIMPNCIYCDEREATSGEHYMPRCMGKFRNFEQLFGKLCLECNIKIGMLDEQLCRCSPEGFFRIVLGIKGRKYHEQINPFYRGSAGSSPIIVETEHPTLNCTIFCEVEKGRKAFPARQIIFLDRQGKYHSILITQKIKIAQQLLSELKAKDLVDLQFIECWFAPGEEEWIERLCKEFDAKIDYGNAKQYGDMGQRKLVATFTVNNNYFRAVAKIAFHYFLKHFLQFTGFEKEFDGIKDFIFNGGESEHWVRQIEGSFIVGLEPYITTDRFGHLLALDKDEHGICAKIHLFIGPGIAPHRYYEIFIGRNPEMIIYHQGVGHQFVYFDEPEEDGYDGRMDPLRTISKSLLI
jgi:hypothetical protein